MTVDELHGLVKGDKVRVNFNGSQMDYMISKINGDGIEFTPLNLGFTIFWQNENDWHLECMEKLR